MQSTRSLQLTSSKPSILLPFLYETRTILRLTPETENACRALRPPPQRRAFTAYSCSQQYVPFDDSEDKPKRPLIRRMNDDQRIQTRKAMEAGTYRPEIQRQEPEQFDLLEEPDDGIESLHAKPKSAAQRSQRDSTITIAEKKAFDQIFEDIRKRSTTKRSTTGTDVFDEEVTGESLQDILSGATQDTQRARVSTSSKRHKESDPMSDIQQAIQSYPKALQSSASKALSVRAAAARVQEGSKADIDRWESIRKPERERVEALMRDASTDIELWNVLESEVFSMIERLGLQSNAEKNGANVAKAALGGKIQARKMDEIEAPIRRTTTPEKPLLDINIHGPLYPAYLLLGLRLLERSFQRPSPLTQSILPRIKVLGLASHALGGSTALYNELLRITWQRHQSLPSIFALLQEMESVGLGFNTDTRDIISEMMSIQNRAQRGEESRRLRTFYSMPAFRDAKLLKTWREKCSEMIRQKALDLERKLEWEDEVKSADAS